jgi:hypothetical protein
MLFNNPKGIAGVTSYILIVTPNILNKYAPELALPVAHHRILLVVTSPDG